VQKVFVIHGEEGARTAFAEQLAGAGYQNVAIPKFKEEFDF
jgi:hypothetical protein